MLRFTHFLLAGTAALVLSSQSVQAQYYSPYSNYSYGSNYGYSNPYGSYYNYRGNGSRYTTPYNNAYRAPSGYAAPTAPNYGSNYRTPPAAARAPVTPYRAPAYGYQRNPRNPYAAGPAYRPPLAYGYPPYYRKKKKDGMFEDGPFSGGDFADELWPGRDSVWEDALPIDGPWNRDWGKAPWNRDYADMYGDEGGPTEWFDWKDPKEGVAVMWEDALYTPHALGTMPGGWDAPTVVVPNPVDVGDEFKDASADFPGEMKDFADGFTYGDRTITGSKAGSNPNAGGIGVGGNKKKDGINIESKPRR